MTTAAETFPLPQRRRVAGLAFGGMRSLRRGSGTDVAGSRPYLPGDDIRRIDRYASARLSAARGSDEWIVRQHYADEAARVVVVADRRPSMSLFPDGLPWLSKPRALRRTTELVAASAAADGCVLGYFDEADDDEPRWLPPGRSGLETLLGAAASADFGAPEDTLDRAFAHLALGARLPAGSFVFVVSDFLSFPADDVVADAVARRWEIVPVVLQDPVWERSFPEVAGAVLPLADPRTGRVRAARLTRREVRRRREEHELRFAGVLDRLRAYGLEPVVPAGDAPAQLLAAFLGWAGRVGDAGGRL